MTADEGASGYIVGPTGVRLWGLDGAERLARQLRSAGVAGVLRGEDPPPARGSVILLRGDYVFEDRTIAALVRQPGVVITASGATRCAAAVAAHVPSRDLAVARAALEGTVDVRAIPDVVAQSPESLSTAFVRDLHKAAPPVVLAARADRVAALERHLFDGSYKGATDLVTKWVWPAPARAVTRLCARYGVTPNAVTAVSFALVVIVTVLFARGSFGAGLALAWVMTFLDTVDGKLARVTVTSTRLGHYFDHSIDAVHPPIWYLAWAWGTTDGPSGFRMLTPLVAAMLVAYLAGRIVESVFEHYVGGCSIFAWRPFDSYFRLILARRNPNLLLLMGFCLVGRPGAGFTAVTVWTVLSSIVLVVRLLQGTVARARGVPLRPWIEELGNRDGAVPWWARPFVSDLADVGYLVQ